MRISRTALAATVLAGITAVGFGVSIGTASAEDVNGKLDLWSFGDIAVDSAHKRVFISDPVDSQIIATNYRGKEIGRIRSLPGVSGLALSADSNTLHAAVPRANAIVSLSATTLNETARYQVGSTVFPHDVTEAGDKIWFAFERTSYSTGAFGSVDPATSEVSLERLRSYANTGSYYPPVVVSNPSAPGLLVVGEVGMSIGRFEIYDVASGAPVLKYRDSIDGTASDFAVSPDGKYVIRAGYGATHRIAVDDRTYTRIHGSAGATSVAIAHDGRVITAGANSYNEPDIRIYQPGADSPESTITLPAAVNADNQSGGNADVLAGSLAVERDGPRLFSVDKGIFAERDHWFYTSNNPDPLITVKLPATAVRGKPMTATGTITAGLALPENTQLSIVRTDVESPTGKAIGTTTVSTSGAFSFTDTPPAGGKVGYTLSFAGSNKLAAASGTAYVTVPRLTPALTFTPSTVYANATTATFTATLGATYKNRVVEIWADPAGNDQQNRLLAKATVNSSGKLSASLRLTRSVTLVAKFAGDAGYLPRSVTSYARTQVKAGTTLTRHYKTAKISSVSYQYFRQSKDPLIAQTMTASSGRKVRTIIQVWSGGRWVLWSGRDTALTAAGKASFTFVTGAKVGKKFRVRAEYIPGKSGDSLNYDTAGAWKYFTYTK